MSDDASHSGRPSLMPPPLAPDDLARQLEGQLADEAGALETLIASVVRGEQVDDQFRSLHVAALRDGRVEALSTAYDRVTREHRLRRMEREHQAALLVHAARFAAEVASDEDAAISYAERAALAAPGADGPLDLADRVLRAAANAARAVELYRVLASRHKDTAEQLALWQRCLRLLDRVPGAREQSLAVRERILKLDPRDEETRAALAREYAAEGRHRDLSKLFESVLAHEPAPPPEQASELRLKLVSLYRDTLREPQRALPHLEQLLCAELVAESALEAADALLESRLLAPRLAPILADTYARLKRPHDELSVLVRELKLARPPRLADVQKRLAVLRLDLLDDVSGALELLEPLVAANAGDDATRRRYLEISARADHSAAAAKLLSRALQHLKDDSARAKVGYDLGSLFVTLGDPAAAQTAFEQVAKLGGNEDAVLAAARRLLELFGPVVDPKKLARALEVIVRLEPDAERKQQAARRLGVLTEKYKLGSEYARTAWRALVDSSEGETALTKLEELCNEQNDAIGLADVLHIRARRAPNSAQARAFAFRSAELRSKADPAGALSAWRSFITRYGPARDAHGRMAELFERTRQWEELGQVLEADARLAEPEERSSIWAKLGRLRLERLADDAGALDALRKALEIDASEATSRAILERLLGQERLRGQAAEILEPIYRAEAEHERLVGLLELKAGLLPDPERRLTLLAEAAELSQGELADGARAIEICRRALHDAALSARQALPGWFERLRSLTAPSARPERLAEIVLEVLGDGDKLERELGELALVAAEALVSAGNSERARSLLERALAEDPTSPELLARIDAISRRDGATPFERIARYHRAIERVEAEERFFELMHAVAAIEARELGSPNAAAATLKQIVRRRPDDHRTHLALLDAYAALEDDAAFDAELERGLALWSGLDRQLTLVRAIERLEARDGDARALELTRTLFDEPALGKAALALAERMFEAAGEIENLRRVLERRVEAASEPGERSAALERLGRFLLEQLGDSALAAEAWRTGARLCHGLPGELERARGLYERVLDAFPSDQEAAERLVEIYAAAGDWAKVPEVYAVSVRGETSDAKRVEVLLALAPRAASAGAVDEFLALADEASWRVGGETPGLGRKLLAAKARVLSASPSRQRDAGLAFRSLVDSYGEDEDVAAFRAFIDETPDENQRREALRWLLQWRASRATNPVSILFEWAEVEEKRLGDREGAIGVYERVVLLQADDVQALSALVRLRLELDRTEAALDALELLRARDAPNERAERDLEMARLALERLKKPSRALDYVARALETAGISEPILELTRRVLGDPEARSRAAELLERASAASERPEAVRIMGLLLEATEHAPELRETRRRWCERLMDLAADDERALLGVALRAAEEFPELDTFWSKAEELAGRIDGLTLLGEAYQRALAEPLDAAAAESVGARAADFFEQILGEPSGAVAALQRVLALSPKARWALDRVKLTLSMQRRYEELLELYDRALSAEHDSTLRAELLDEAVVVARDLANDPDLATGYLEELHTLRPADARIDATLERLYERQGRPKKLIELLEKRIAGLPELERLEPRQRIAGLWLELQDPAHALALIEPMLGQPERSAAAVLLLERVLALPTPLGDESTVAAERRAAELLTHEYTRLERTADLVRVVEREVELFDDPTEKALRLRRIAALRLEPLADEPGAFDAVCQLIRLEPDADEHRDRAAALAGKLGKQERLAEVLTRTAEEADPPRTALLVEAARLYAEELDDKERASELYLGALERSDHDPGVARTAARALEGLLRSEGKTAERCAILERLASLADESSERNAALAEAARVAFEELKDADRAALDWQRLLEHAPGDLAALGGLIQALRAAGRPRALADALNARASATDDPEAARRDRVRVAHLYAEELDDQDAAAAAWLAIREQFGRDTQSFDALCDLYEKSQKWDSLVRFLAEEAGVERKAERKRLLYLRLAGLEFNQLSDPNAAIKSYAHADDWASAKAIAEGVSADDRQHKTVLRGLLKIATSAWKRSEKPPDSPEAQSVLWAIRALGRRLLRDRDPKHALELYLKGATLPFAPLQKRELRRDAAWLAASELGQQQRAIEILRELFAEDTADPVATAAAGRYAELLDAEGLHTERAELYERLAHDSGELGNTAQAEEQWTRAAELWESSAASIERATSAYGRAAELGSDRALEALARLHRARGDDRAAAEALDRLLEQATRETRAERALTAAEAYWELGERAISRERFEAARRAGAEISRVCARLADIYRSEGAWEPLAALLSAEAAEDWDAAHRAELFHTAARLYADRLADPTRALPLLEQAIEAAPDRPELRLELATLLGAVGRHDAALEVLARRIEEYGSRRPKDRALVHRQRGEIYLAAGRRSEALGELELAVQIDPTRTEILFPLARLAQDEGRLADAEQAYRALLLAVRRPAASDERAPALSEVYVGLSEVARRRGDETAAADLLESAFETALGDWREGLGLERALGLIGREDLLPRAVQARVDHASDPELLAQALADLVELTIAKPDVPGEKPDPGADFGARMHQRAGALRDTLTAELATGARAWRALHRIFTRLGDQRSAAGVVGHWVASLDPGVPDADAGGLYELAEICLETAEHQAAGASLLERALELRPDAERALGMLRPVVERDAPGEQAVRLFEKVCRGPGREALRAQALARVAALSDAGMGELREAVDFALSLDDRALAESILKVARARDADDLGPADRTWALLRSADLAEKARRPGEAAGLYEQAAEIAPDAKQKKKLSFRAAELWMHELGEYGRASAILSRLLDADPTDSAIWDRALELAKKSGRPKELIELVDRNAPRIKPRELMLRLLLEQAKLLLVTEAPDEALEVLKRAVELDPNHAEAADLRARLLEETGRVDELVILLRARVEKAIGLGDSAPVLRLSLRLGGLLERATRSGEALQAYHDALRAEPANLEALRAIARLSETDALGAEDLAATLEELLKLEEGTAAAEAALKLAAIRSEQWNDPGAERALLKGFAADPTHRKLLRELSERFSERGQWQKLVELLTQALEAAPADREIGLRLSEAFRRAGQPDRGLEVLEAIGGADDFEIAHQRFVVLQAARKTEQALEALEQAARLSPRFVDELETELERAAAGLAPAKLEARMLGLIELVERSGDAGRARELLRRLAQANPPPRAALERLARLEHESENWLEALGAYRRLLSLELADGDLEKAAIGLADACEKAGRAADARADLERALENAPQSKTLRTRLRRLYEKIGARDQLARTYLSEASDEVDGLARVGALVNAGTLMLESGSFTQAIRVLERAHEQEPAHIEAALLLSRAYRNAGLKEKALATSQETAKQHERTRSKDAARLHREIADLHLETDELVEAFEALKLAFDRNKADPGLALELGLLALDLDEPGVALQSLQAVTVARPGSGASPDSGIGETRSVAYYHLGRMAWLGGDQAKARLMASKALREDPENSLAKSFSESLASG